MTTLDFSAHCDLPKNFQHKFCLFSRFSVIFIWAKSTPIQFHKVFPTFQKCCELKVRFLALCDYVPKKIREFSEIGFSCFELVKKLFSSLFRYPFWYFGNCYIVKFPQNCGLAYSKTLFFNLKSVPCLLIKWCK